MQQFKDSRNIQKRVKKSLIIAASNSNGNIMTNRNASKTRKHKWKKKKLYGYFKQHAEEIGWLVAFYGISTFVGYLMPKPFLYK